MAERSTVNSEYWERRFQAIESENHQKAKLTAADTIEAYKEACRNCQKEIEAWYGRFAQNNGITIAEARTMLSKQELEELKWDVEQYIKALEDNESSGKWVKELENASARYHISKYEGLQIRLRQQIEAAAAVEQGNLMHHLTDVYGETMYKTAYEMQSGLNTGFEIAKVNEKQINAVLNRPWAADGKAFSDRIWQRKEELKQKLDNEITRNIMLGKGVKDSTMSIAREFGVTENRAATLVYTETAYVASEAQKAQFKELGVEQFEIVATLDNHTSAICQEMDGKHIPMSDFKSGVTAPPFHPNCRSVTVPYLDDEFREIFGESERAARDENGKTVSVPEDMTYPEWKKVFVDKEMSLEEWKKQRKLPYIDITDNWYPDAVPNSHKIEDMLEYTVNGVTYKVDGKHIVLDYSKYEKNIAEILESQVGGKLFMVPRIVYPVGISTPDFMFNGFKYDLKTIVGESKNVLYNSVAKKKLQSSKFIFDISECPLSEDEIIEQVGKLYTSNHTKFIDEIVLIKNKKIIFVTKRKTEI